MTLEALSIATPPPAASPTDDNIIEGEVKVIPEGDGEGEPKPEPEAKPEKTAEQREIDRLRRGIDRRTRQLSDARAQLDLTRTQKQPDNSTTADDSEPLTLTRAQIDEMVKAEATRLAPTFREEALEVERRQGVIQSLAKTWGQEKFDEVSSDLDEAFGGLTDRSGRPKPATEAIFEADEPARVIEFLADPDNADEAERISKLSAVQAGKAIAKLEAKLSTQVPKPTSKVSKAPAPLEAVRGQGSVSSAPDPSNTKAWIQWRNEQERAGR
jgi:hypothetical protein